MKNILFVAAIAAVLCFVALVAVNHWDAHMNTEKGRLYAKVLVYEKEIEKMNELSELAEKLKGRSETLSSAAKEEQTIQVEEVEREIGRIEGKRSNYEGTFREYTSLIGKYNSLPGALFRKDESLPEKLSVMELKK